MTVQQAQGTPSDDRYTALDLRRVSERDREQTDVLADGRITGYFLRFGQMTPSPTLPRRKRLFPGADGFTTVYGTSGWQGLAHLPGSPAAGSLPCFYNSREKFVHFGSTQPCRAQLVRARAYRGQNSDFEKKLRHNVWHVLEAFLRFYASETLIFLKKVGKFSG